MSGAGTVVATTVVRVAPPGVATPYALAAVTWDGRLALERVEGPPVAVGETVVRSGEGVRRADAPTAAQTGGR